MCRETFSSHRTRSVGPAADMNEMNNAVEGPTMKQRALNEETLPQTLSTGCSSSASDAEEPHDAELSRLCPVTGRLSNVLDEYVVFPKVLGKGYYGCVRECVHRSSRMSYACKSIDKSKIGRLDHLQREVQLLSQMDHRGIIRMVDCHEDADYVHIVTEKYTGGELYERIVDNTTDAGCYSERRAARIVWSLLESIAYLHDNDVVHRDIKPENILFESEDEESVRLIDFGLSRMHTKGDAPMSNPVGTAYYMSPEVLKGSYGRSTDLWSVGVTAYILLCGYPPFNGETDSDILGAVRKGHFEFPKGQWDDKSDHAKDLVRRLLRRDPRRRLTAREALEHPWIKNGGRKQKIVKRINGHALRYLWIP